MKALLLLTKNFPVKSCPLPNGERGQKEKEMRLLPKGSYNI